MARKDTRAAARRLALNEAARMVEEIGEDAESVAHELGQANSPWIRGAKWMADRVRRRLREVATHARRGP